MQKAYDLGLLLKELRKKAGLSQKELGEKINRDKGVISRFESNLQTPTFDTMRIMAGIFNVSMDYLAGFENESCVSNYGLNSKQTRILKDLANIYRQQNSQYVKQMSDEQYKMLGRITASFTEK